MTTSTTNTMTTTELNRWPTTTSTITTTEGRDRGQGGWKWTQMMCRTCHLGLSESFFFLSLCILILTDVFYRYSSITMKYMAVWVMVTNINHHHQWGWSGFGRDGAQDVSHLEPQVCNFFSSFSFFFTHYILDISGWTCCWWFWCVIVVRRSLF